MLDHYFANAWHKFARNPVTTGLNVFALALGFACFIAATGVARYWAMADAHFEGSEEIYIVTSSYGEPDDAGSASGFFTGSAMPVGPNLREDYPQIEAVGRIMFNSTRVLETNERRVRLRGGRADADIVRVFEFDFIAGDPHSALDAPDKLVLTRSAAQSLFGEASPIGQSVALGTDALYQVSAVIEDHRRPSHMADTPGAINHFDYLYGWPEENFDVEWWLATTGQTYLRFSPDSELTPAALDAQLGAFIERRVPENQRGLNAIRLGLLPLSGVQANQLDRVIFGGNMSDLLTVTNVIAGLGILVLIVACVNYANLTTAQAANRVREVGLRKALGAGRSEVLAQYWIEALILTALATTLTLVLIWIFSPLVERTTFIDLRVGLFSEVRTLALIGAVAVGVSFLACLYPVAILSRVRPVDAIRTGSVRTGPKLAMKIMIGVQFAVASSLLISLIVINGQNAHLRQIALSQTDPIAFLMDRDSRGVGYLELQSALEVEPSIEAVSQLSFLPWGAYSNYIEGTRSPGGDDEWIDIFRSDVGLDFFEAFDMPLLAGRAFDPGRDQPAPAPGEWPDTNYTLRVVIDRPLSEWLGYDTPDQAIGQLFYSSQAQRQAFGVNLSYEIIGVVEPMPLTFARGADQANAYIFAAEGAGLPVIRFNGERFPQGLERLRQAVDARAPNALVSPRFFDDLFERSFAINAAVNSAFSGLSFIAFAVSVIGLVAMSIFVAGRRRHEIGVRKTLGASTLEVTGLLLRDFTVPVLIGNLIAWPAAWLVARTYIGSFTEQVALTPLPWLLGLAVTLAIAWVAVGGQAWRAARVKPALVLRHE